MRILVVEDERRVADFVKRGLVEEGHDVDIARDGASALERGATFDAIVLDVGLPDRSGLDVAAALRRAGVLTPILMLTARDTPEDIVRGLDAGADDYLTKPFDFAELVARLRALERRAAAGPSSVVRAGDIELDRIRHEARRAGVAMRLTQIEYRLLEVLMMAGGATVSRAALLERVWGMRFDPGTGLIDVHVANLRQKLEQRGGTRVIHAVKGVGFRLMAGES